MFLASVLVCIVLALVWTTRPLWSGAVDAGQARRAANVAAYRQRISELEADHAAGLIDASTHDALRAELDARLLADAGEGRSADAKTGRGAILAVVLVLLIPLVAVLGYVDSGSWKLDRKIALVPEQTPPSQDEIEQLVDALAQQMEAEPEHLEGWVLLARSSFQLGRYKVAANAYQRASALSDGQEPAYLVGEGESLAMARNRQLKGRPRELFKAALKLNPDHPRALWYAALAAEQEGETTEARQLWMRLSRQDIPDEFRSALQARLAATAPPSTVPSTGDGFGMAVEVSLDPELRDKAAADASLFVFARAAEGPPMPLAVYRGTAGELPATVRLDDSMAMMPTMKLSDFDEWDLVARISFSGQPQAQSGDLQGSLTVERSALGGSALHLLISEVVP